MDWSNIVLKGAQISSALLNTFLSPMPLSLKRDIRDGEGTDGEKSGEVTQGDVTWKHVIVDGKRYIQATNNNESRPYGLNFSLSGVKLAGQGEHLPFTRVEHVPLKPTEEKDLTKQLFDYQDGHVCVAPLAGDAIAKGPLEKDGQDMTLTFSIAYLPLGVSVEIEQGLSMKVVKDTQNTYSVQLTAQKGQIKQVEVTAQGSNGSVVTGSQTFGADDGYTVKFPAGTNLDPLVQSLMIHLTLPSVGYHAYYGEKWNLSRKKEK